MTALNLIDLGPEQLIDPKWMEAEYKPRMKEFYDHVVRLNTHLHFLDQLFSFPYSILYALHENTNFLRYARESFVWTAILGISRLIKDSDGYTLPRFQNDLGKNGVKLEYRKDYFRSFHGLGFPDNDELVKKVHDIRNGLVAHIDKNLAFGSDGLLDISLDELRMLRDRINRFYEGLSFEAPNHSSYLYDQYWGDKTSDLDQILTDIAKRSPLLRKPDDIYDQYGWLIMRQGMSEQQFATFNKWRKRCELSEVG